ncbi:hypothetical protein [Actinopolyspora mortivallis]|uniref:hypothetical protein n=1 Tax=Actinopolyspora mortivallis TaxID=33906 RepID=UPI0011B1FD3E|nr:hypothetical protein [Actinopolyspora mortivallis]
MTPSPSWILGTLVVLAGAVIVAEIRSRRGTSPRHAGGSGPAAWRLAAVRWEPPAHPDPPTVELIRWPLCDPDRHPRLFEPTVPEPAAPSVPGTPGGGGPDITVDEEPPELALMRRVLAGLHRLHRN